MGTTAFTEERGQLGCASVESLILTEGKEMEKLRVRDGVCERGKVGGGVSKIIYIARNYNHKVLKKGLNLKYHLSIPSTDAV